MAGAKPELPGSDASGQALRKRFYKDVAVAPEGPTFKILLDGRSVRTPRKSLLAVPTEPLAYALAKEWSEQGDQIDPQSMPLTRMVNTALDGVRGREVQVRADIAGYAGSDLICYFAEGPRELVDRQSRDWGTVHVWAQEALRCRLAVAAGVMPVAQSPEAVAQVAQALEAYDAFQLTALHVMTTLTGSVLLALAHARGAITAERAWKLAHLDEDWQISQWGEDAEAAAHRARRWLDMHAASRLLALSGGPGPS